jgi:predicted transcriptional regulator
MDPTDGVDEGDDPGYTFGMKTAVSLPDEVFEGADRLARKMKKSRSQLYADALAAYLAQHDADEITAAIDRVCEATGGEHDPAVSAAARRALEDVEW